MEPNVLENAQILWDYMTLRRRPEPSQVILGLGSYDITVAHRCAELYLQGLAPRILFTGGLGRNTRERWTQPEAMHFRDIALADGVPEQAIFLETQSTNTGENIRFSRAILEPQGIRKILAVTKPFMERRVMAVVGVVWPEADCCPASPDLDLPAYLRASADQGMPEEKVLNILTGDFQRLSVYADRGFQLPQQIPARAWDAFHWLCRAGYDQDLVL